MQEERWIARRKNYKGYVQYYIKSIRSTISIGRKGKQPKANEKRIT
jgi:hypothetical protein